MSAPTETATDTTALAGIGERRRTARAADRGAPLPLAGVLGAGFASLQRTVGTALLEIRLNLTGAAPWVIGLILALLGYLTVRTAPDNSSFPLGWALSAEMGLLAVVLLLFLAASLANRPQRYDVSELLDSKLVASEELILGRWIGMVVAILVPVGCAYAATIIGQKIHSKQAIVAFAYVQSFGRFLPPVLFFTTLAFTLVAITRILHLGAGLAALLWFVLYAGPEHHPTLFKIELSQNAPFFLGLAGTTLLALLLACQGRRRAKGAPTTRILAVLTGLACTGTAVYGAWAHLDLPGKERAVAAYRRLEGRRWDGSREPIPNFAWTDQHGKRVSLAALRGKPALLVFVQPRDGGLILLLRRLAGLRREYSGRVSVLPIFLAEDLNAAAQAVQVAGADLLVVTDWGAPRGRFDEKLPGSVIAWRLGLERTPIGVFTDAEGKITQRDVAVDDRSWDELKTKMKAAAEGKTAIPSLNPESIQSAIEGALRQ